MLLLNLADVLRAAGETVVEHAGWRGRHHGELVTVQAIVVHHTGSAAMPGAVNVVRDGRPGLPGPLAQLALDPDGRWHVLGSGQAWHAGTGGPLVGMPRDGANARSIGIEGVSNGTAWTPAQRAAYPRGVAALSLAYGVPVDRVVGHKEWAPGRKPDPGNWLMTDFRAEVTRYRRELQEDDDVTAEQVWNHRVENMGGERVPAFLVLRETERRVADVQRRLGPLEAEVLAKRRSLVDGAPDEAAYTAGQYAALIDRNAFEVAAAVPELLKLLRGVDQRLADLERRALAARP